MAYTLLQMCEIVQKDCDLQSSTGSLTTGSRRVEPADIKRKIGEVVKIVQAHIHNLYADYFQVGPIALNVIAGTAEYALPASIYLNKVRRFFYNNGSLKYTIDRITDIDDTQDVEAADDYRYMIIDNGTAQRIRIYPTPRETTATFFTLWFYRRAKALTLDADIMDIPDEFEDTVLSGSKYRALMKEINNPLRQMYKDEYGEGLALMIETLKKRFPDKQGEQIEPDTSFYEVSVA